MYPTILTNRILIPKNHITALLNPPIETKFCYKKLNQFLLSKVWDMSSYAFRVNVKMFITSL